MVEVDPSLDRDLQHIAIAKVLGIPAPMVTHIGLHWSAAAMVDIESKNLIEEHFAKRRKRK